LLSARERAAHALATDPRAIAEAATVLLLLSIIYALTLRFSRLSLNAQAGAQFFCDVITVTWLVGSTDELHTPFVALYVVVISLASIYLGARGALVTAVGCAACYTSLALAAALGWTHSRDGMMAATSTGDLATSVGLYDVAFLFVGLLAARLVERQARSDVQLVEASNALSNLRALHERIVDSIRSGVVTTDLNGSIFTVNKAAEEITGYEASALRGEDVSILFGQIKDKIGGSLRAIEEGRLNPRFEAECLTTEGLRLLDLAAARRLRRDLRSHHHVSGFNAGARARRDAATTGQARGGRSRRRRHRTRDQKPARGDARIDSSPALRDGRRLGASGVDGDHPARI
jgi:two-component system sensor histidine kinase PilS (NtrC family)